MAFDTAIMGLHTPMMGRHSGVPKHAVFSPLFRALWHLWTTSIRAALMRGKRPSSALKVSAF